MAAAHGFVVSRQPVMGSMVVYGSAYGLLGHIATVVAVRPNRYEVLEQNFLDFSRSVWWPDPAVVGFVVGPA